MRVHRRLRVVALDEAVGRLLDLRVGIGEVPLGLRRRRRLVGCLPALSRLLARLSLERCLRLADPLEPALAPGQLRGQLIASPVRPVPGVLVPVRLLGATEQLRDLRLQDGLVLRHPPVAPGLVRGGVRLDPGPVDRHLPELDQPGAPTQPQPLRERAGQRHAVPLPEVAERPEVGE